MPLSEKMKRMIALARRKAAEKRAQQEPVDLLTDHRGEAARPPVTLETFLNDLDFGGMSRSDVVKLLRKLGFHQHPEAALSDEDINRLCDILLGSDLFKDADYEGDEKQRAVAGPMRAALRKSAR